MFHQDISGLIYLARMELAKLEGDALRPCASNWSLSMMERAQQDLAERKPQIEARIADLERQLPVPA